MMKENNIMRKFIFTFAILVTVLIVGLSFNDLTAKAAETSTEDKTLLQYSNDWTIFQYVDDTGDPMFDVKYLDKTPEELEADNLLIQYRTIYQNYDEFELINSSWYDLNTVLSEEVQNEIENNKQSYFIQFRVVNVSDVSTGVSMSDTFIIWPQEEPFPYIISSSIDYCEVYDLETQPAKLEINIKFSEPLKKISIVGISQNTNISSELISNDYFRKILSRESISENVTIEGKEYTIQYYDVSCEIQFPSLCYLEDTSEVNIKYLLTFDGLVGETSEKEPTKLMLTVCTPTSTSESTLVESITLSAPTSTLYPGDTIALTADILPENATHKDLIWASSNSNYATVDENGVVTAKAAGAGKTVTITAKSIDGSNISATYNLEIKPIPVTGITISSPNSSVIAGDKITLTSTVTPANATNRSITWSSSNTDYATVDPYGVVTTTAAGAGKTVIITATAKDGSNIIGSYTLEIKPILVSKVTIKSSSKTVQAGKKLKLTATVSPANATNKSLKWTSSNTKYATVSSTGVVTTKKAGAGKTVTITAKATDGSNQKMSFKLKIQKVSVKKLKITGKKTVTAGKKITLKATVSPSNATNKAVKWTTSNKKYATVSAKGVVTAKKAGRGKTVTITATAKDGSGKKATMKIKIK